MGGLSIDVDLTSQLNMLSRLGTDIPDGLDKGLQEAAEIGADWVDERLNSVLRKQTPYYRLQVAARKTPPGWVITDGGVVYGPWLEGVSRRNQTTRFKGYRTFRTIAQRMARESVVFVERNIMLALRKAQG
jgi:hypothetical protein